jgi:hypothetical protein
MDETAQEAMAFDGSATRPVDMTAGGNSEWVLSTCGADHAHAGFVFAPPDGDSLAATAQIWSVSNPAAADSPWHFNWVIAKDPAANDHVGADMEGDCFGFSRFIASLGDQRSSPCRAEAQAVCPGAVSGPVRPARAASSGLKVRPARRRLAP